MELNKVESILALNFRHYDLKEANSNVKDIKSVYTQFLSSFFTNVCISIYAFYNSDSFLMLSISFLTLCQMTYYRKIIDLKSENTKETKIKEIQFFMFFPILFTGAVSIAVDPFLKIFHAMLLYNTLSLEYFVTAFVILTYLFTLNKIIFEHKKQMNAVKRVDNLIHKTRVSKENLNNVKNWIKNEVNTLSKVDYLISVCNDNKYFHTKKMLEKRQKELLYSAGFKNMKEYKHSLIELEEMNENGILNN